VIERKIDPVIKDLVVDWSENKEMQSSPLIALHRVSGNEWNCCCCFWRRQRPNDRCAKKLAIGESEAFFYTASTTTHGGRTFQHMHHAKQNRRVQLLLLSLFAGIDILLPSGSGQDGRENHNDPHGFSSSWIRRSCCRRRCRRRRTFSSSTNVVVACC
jgi:hypothetical protein